MASFNQEIRYPMRERRCFVRVPVGVEVSYHFGEEADAPHLGMSEDVSQEGMRISQPEPLEKGKEILVSFSLPSGGRMEITGKVVWCSNRPGAGQQLYHAGLRWIQINQTVRSRLNSFLIERIVPGTPIMGFDSSPAVIRSMNLPQVSVEIPAPPAREITGPLLIRWGAIALAFLAVAFLGVLIGFWIYPR